MIRISGAGSTASTWHRSTALLGAVAVCVGVGWLTPVAAQAAPEPRGPATAQEPDKPGEPARPAPLPPAPENCVLTDPDSPRSEFAHCITADVELDATPELGEAATAVLTVRSQEDVADAVVTLSLNDNFSLVSAAGFADADQAPSGVGPVASVSRTVDLTAGEPSTFKFTVRAQSDGFGVVQAKVDGGSARTTASDETAVRLGGAAATSPTGGLAVAPAPAKAPAAPDSSPADYKPATVAGPDPLSPNAPGASCATGRWVFNNELGQQTSSMNVQVQVWDQDEFFGDDHLATGVTGGDGGYNICFESTDGDFGGNGGGQEVYVRFVTEVNQWRVRNDWISNSNYVWSTGVSAIPDPGTANFGTLQPADGALHRALHAYDGINLLWLWQSGVSGCLDDPGQCRQMIVNWTPTSTDGTYYSLGGNDIHLAAADPDADHTTIHEGAHALMDALYDDAFPPAPNCSPHSIFGASSEGCAWTEGWAEWVPARVLNDPFYRWPDGGSLNLETPGWTDGLVQGDVAEGRIAGALIDLSDNANEAPWDRYGEAEGYGAQFEEIYTTSRLEVSNTLNEFFNTDRPGEGDTGFLPRTSVFANTINYTQRDPLFSFGELSRPSLSAAPSPHNYSYNTVTNYWSGVAIRGGNDNDLTLYDDVAQSVSLGGSAFGGNAIDYVLVDSNERAFGDYFPRAYLFSGSGPYAIEWAAGSTSLGEGSAGVSFGAGDVILVRDAFASGGVPNFVRVVPTGGLDVDLFAHDSTAGSAGTFVQGRGAAIAASGSGGAGAPEAIQYTVADGDWTGIVLLNKGGSGSATVYRDQSAPAGAAVEIDGGASTTNDQQVDLALSANDPQTGMMDMRVSVDGVFDTETFEPYATSRTVTLPPGDGMKTVTVQFRNNAGAVSTASDSIQLIVPTVPGAPTVTNTIPAGGRATVEFTPGSDGNSPITGYLAVCASTDGGVSKSAPGTGSPITVDQLTPEKTYRCRVRAINAVGSSPFSAFGSSVLLPPATVPTAPTVTNTTPQGGRATVAFTRGYDGGSPITGYLAVCASTDGGVSKSAPGTSSPITVDQLTPEKTYRCRVRAINAVGSSPFSAFGSPVLLPPATVPTAPTVVNTVPGVGRATVAFRRGYDGGSPITGFTASCVSTDGGVTRSAAGTASPIPVTGLSVGNSYHCRVRATNAVGSGPFSAFGATVVIPASIATPRHGWDRGGV